MTGSDCELAIDLRALRGMIDALKARAAGAGWRRRLGAGRYRRSPPSRKASSARSTGTARRGGGPQSIESREDAIKALQAICAYLERSEPTNPAQLLLRRAERLIDKSFPAARARSRA
jgi:type VI secretion system protein ImpA